MVTLRSNRERTRHSKRLQQQKSQEQGPSTGRTRTKNSQKKEDTVKSKKSASKKETLNVSNDVKTHKITRSNKTVSKNLPNSNSKQASVDEKEINKLPNEPAKLQRKRSRTNRLTSASDLSDSSRLKKEANSKICTQTIKIQNSKPLLPPTALNEKNSSYPLKSEILPTTPAIDKSPTSVKSLKKKSISSKNSSLPYSIKSRRAKGATPDATIAAETKSLGESLSLCTTLLNKSRKKSNAEVPQVKDDQPGQAIKVLNQEKLAQLEKDMNMHECSISPILPVSRSKKRKTVKLNNSLLKTPLKTVFTKLPKAQNTSLFDDSGEEDSGKEPSQDELPKNKENDDNIGFAFYPLTDDRVPLNEVKVKRGNNTSVGSQKIGKSLTEQSPNKNYEDWLTEHEKDYDVFRDVNLCIE